MVFEILYPPGATGFAPTEFTKASVSVIYPPVCKLAAIVSAVSVSVTTNLSVPTGSGGGVWIGTDEVEVIGITGADLSAEAGAEEEGGVVKFFLLCINRKHPPIIITTTAPSAINFCCVVYFCIHIF